MNKDRDVGYNLLSLIAKSSVPMGAGVLYEQLSNVSDRCYSEATIGRHLRNLEHQGFLEIKRYNGRSRGRVITEEGRAYLAKCTQEKEQTQSVMQVIDFFNNGLDTQLRNILITRAIIEPEVAAAAAANATEENLERMHSILNNMDTLILGGEKMAKTDVPFHNEIAKASGNPVFEAIMLMLRTDQDYTPEVEYIIGTGLLKSPSGHWNIYEAIKARDCEKASILMRQHIENLIAKLDAYKSKDYLEQ